MRCEPATRAQEQHAVREILSSPPAITAAQYAQDVIPQPCALAPRPRVHSWLGLIEKKMRNTTKTGTDGKADRQLAVCVRFCRFTPKQFALVSCAHRVRIRAAVSTCAAVSLLVPRTCFISHIASREATLFNVCAIACVFLHSYIRAWTTGAKRRGDECLIRDVSSCSFPPPRQ
jgi:hypothetical protein